MLRFLIALICFMAWTTAHAASGDFEVVVQVPTEYLSTALKIEAKNLIEAIKPGADGSKIVRLDCTKDFMNADTLKQQNWTCVGRWEAIDTEKKYIQFSQKGLVAGCSECYSGTAILKDQYGAPTDSVRFIRKSEDIAVEGDALTKLKSFVANAYPGITASIAVGFVLEKVKVKENKVDVVKVTSTSFYVDTINAGTSVVLKKINLLRKIIREIP